MELGTFCEQYGFDPLIAPSRKRKKEKKDVDRYKTNNRRYSKSRSKEKKEESKRNKRDRENEIICFKCGKKGHTSRYCNFQRKINKLDISGKLKDKLMSILEQTNNDETDNEIH